MSIEMVFNMFPKFPFEIDGVVITGFGGGMTWLEEAKFWINFPPFPNQGEMMNGDAYPPNLDL